MWQALTQKEQIEKWLMPSDDFELAIGKTFHMIGSNKGTQIPHICTIVEIVPEKKLSYTWAVKDMLSDTLVTYELEEQDGKTKLTLTHSGWDKATVTNDNAGRDAYNGGWEQVIPGLKKYVESN